MSINSWMHLYKICEKYSSQVHTQLYISRASEHRWVSWEFIEVLFSNNLLQSLLTHLRPESPENCNAINNVKRIICWLLMNPSNDRENGKSWIIKKKQKERKRFKKFQKLKVEKKWKTIKRSVIKDKKRRAGGDVC